MRYALDSNVVLAWLFPEQDSAARGFIASLDDNDEMMCAPLLFAECTSVIRRQIFDQRIDHDQGMHRLRILLDLPIQLATSLDQFSRALELARRFRHRKAYDMQHLAVAESVNAELVTIDRGLRHAAEAIGVPVRFLA